MFPCGWRRILRLIKLLDGYSKCKWSSTNTIIESFLHLFSFVSLILLNIGMLMLWHLHCMVCGIFLGKTLCCRFELLYAFFSIVSDDLIPLFVKLRLNNNTIILLSASLGQGSWWKIYHPLYIWMWLQLKSELLCLSNCITIFSVVLQWCIIIWKLAIRSFQSVPFRCSSCLSQLL